MPQWHIVNILNHISLRRRNVHHCFHASFFTIYLSRRIWRTRCTLPSRGDARCWRIFTTPKASAEAPASHQSPPNPPPSDLCLLLLPFLCALTLFCFSQLSYLLPLPLSLPSSPPPSHSHYAAESQNGTTVSSQPSSFLLLASCFWLQSVTFREDSLAEAFHV